MIVTLHVCELYFSHATNSVKVKTNLLSVKMEELTVINARLEEELKTSEHTQLMEGQQGLETLKLRNKFLQERIEQQEKKISTLELTKKLGNAKGSEGTPAAGQLAKKLEELQEKEKELGKQRQKLQEENTKLKYDLER